MAEPAESAAINQPLHRNTRASRGAGIFAFQLLALLPVGPVAATPEMKQEPPEETFIINGELGWLRNELKNVSLGNREQDDARNSEREIKLQLSYRPSDRLSTLGEIKASAQRESYDATATRTYTEEYARGETWLRYEQLFDSNYALQIGRQNFTEPRRWWWDDDLDAIRVHYAGQPWHLYLGVAQELARTSSRDDFIDPEKDKVRRLIGHASWSLSDELNFDAFYLRQRDNSERPPVDSVIDTVRTDESDADLTWAGLRLSGDIAWSSAMALSYWMDAAMVSGDETVFEFIDDAPGSSRVRTSRQRHVRGRAIDVGAVWKTSMKGTPTFTLNFARGSGDKESNDDIDRMYRQTGLRDPDEEFRAYGELLRPELSNLSIASAKIGLAVSPDSHLTLGYHRFWQVYPAAVMRAARIDADPNGVSKDIGSELSLLVEVREWDDLEIDVAAAAFKAHSAFGAAAGTRSNSLFLKLTYKF